MLKNVTAITPEKQRRGEAGFTFIEVLIVIVIIGVLAAIALPSLLGQGAKAKDAQAKTLVRNAYGALEAHLAVSDVFTLTEAELLVEAPVLGQAEAWDLTTTPTSYRLSVTSKSGNVFTVTRSTGSAAARSCEPAGEGGCPPSGDW